jgi:AcrR family transcriptional regulator
MMATQRPTLRDRRRAELRERIILAALPLFADHGFDAVTLDEIAAATGISLSTLVRHVSSKDDLLIDSVHTGRSLIVANFKQRPADEPIRESLARAILGQVEQFDDRTETIELWRRAMATAPQRIRRAAFLDEDERRQLIALAPTRLKTTDELAAGVVVHSVLAAAEYAYDYWLSQPTKRTLRDLTREALQIVSSQPE